MGHVVKKGIVIWSLGYSETIGYLEILIKYVSGEGS